MKTLLVILAFSFVVSAHARPYQRRYKYYLDANRAEEILAGIGTRQRLYDDEWLGILGTERKNQTYTVNKGDTLWSISRNIVTDSFLWRKFWQMNPFLTNPHELEVGQILQLYNEQGDEAAIRIPLIKLLPGGANDLDADSFVNIDIKNKFHPKLMVVDDDSVMGEITGGYTEKEAFGNHDEFYLYFYEGGNVKAGDIYSIVRYERSLADNTQPGAPTIGNLARLLGEVKVTQAGEELFRAEIKSMFYPIRRGDKIIPFQAPIRPSALLKAPDELEVRVVMGEDTERKAFGQGELILLNKGSSDGMRAGFFFRVYRDVDPFTRRRRDVEPSYKGEVQIVQASELSAVGYITRNEDPIFIGDTLVAAQSFPDPPPSPLKNRDPVEID